MNQSWSPTRETSPWIGLPRVILVAVSAVQFESEPNDTTITANKITLGRPIQGEVSLVGDQDWFIVHLAAGRTFEVELFGTRYDQATWEAAGTVPRLAVFFPNGVSKLLEHSFTSGWSFGAQDFDIPRFRVNYAGSYWFVVRPDDDLAVGGRYVLRVRYVNPIPTQFELEPANQIGIDDTPGTAQPISPGTISGNHRHANDDYYALAVSGPRVLRVEIVAQRDGAVGGAPTLYDPLLRLYDVDGSTLLPENDDAFSRSPARAPTSSRCRRARRAPSTLPTSCSTRPIRRRRPRRSNRTTRPLAPIRSPTVRPYRARSPRGPRIGSSSRARPGTWSACRSSTRTSRSRRAKRSSSRSSRPTERRRCPPTRVRRSRS